MANRISLAMIVLMLSCSKEDAVEQPFPDIADIRESTALHVLKLHVLDEYGGIEVPIRLLKELTLDYFEECDVELTVPSERQSSSTTYSHDYEYSHECEDVTVPSYTDRHHLTKYNGPLVVSDPSYTFDVYHNRTRLQVYGSRDTDIFGLTGKIWRTANLAMELPHGYDPHVEVTFRIAPCTYDHEKRTFLEVNRIDFDLSIVVAGLDDRYETGRAYFGGYIEYRSGIPFVIFENTNNKYPLR